MKDDAIKLLGLYFDLQRPAPPRRQTFSRFIAHIGPVFRDLSGGARSRFCAVYSRWFRRRGATLTGG